MVSRGAEACGVSFCPEVFSQRYERAPSWSPPTCLSTNGPKSSDRSVLPERLTGALLDRLTHHVHILEMNGESYRLKHSRENTVPASDEPHVS